jgi:general secretion pathway protein E
VVFSTLHTNTAVGAIARLRDMGVEPFLLSSSLVAVLAQRLVRALCSDCKQPQSLSPSEYDQLRSVVGNIPSNELPTIYAPKGCNKCNNSGYTGRTGIYELIVLDESIRTMIHDMSSERDLERHARTLSPSIREDGMRLVLAGKTTLEEVMRVSQED